MLLCNLNANMNWEDSLSSEESRNLILCEEPNCRDKSKLV
jgi:hypothetical protein